MGVITADFTYTPVGQVTHEAVEFTGTASSIDGESPVEIVKWEWQLEAGDAILEGASTASKTYTEAGVKVARMRATDADGVQKVITKNVVIYEKYKVTGEWLRKPRARVTITEYEAGPVATGNTWREPFDVVGDTVESLTARFMAKIGVEPEIPPGQVILNDIQNTLNEEIAGGQIPQP